MKLLPCPVCGTRNLSEFFYYGVRRPLPDLAKCSDAEWAQYLFYRQGMAGVKEEWWCHLPCNEWFALKRDTSSDEILGIVESGDGA